MNGLKAFILHCGALALAASLAIALPSAALADEKDKNLADEIYEKYKQRKEKDAQDDLVDRRRSNQRSGNNGSRKSYERAERYSLDQAVNMVRREYGGKVIRAESRDSGGRRLHYVKVHTDDGRVRTFKVDATSGKIR
ncbi:MAG: PepSY domain-containing protein [Pseudomonadota bacterium]